MDFKRYYSTEVRRISWGNGGQGIAKCPFHDDSTPSLSVNAQTGLFKCHGCNAKGSIVDFHMKKHGLDRQEARNELTQMRVLKTGRQVISATYDYHDESGQISFQVVRTEPKSFYQRRPDGQGGWINNLQGVRRVPYNLPEVIQAETVYIAEGERDAEALKEMDLVATCNPMGAGNWKDSYNEFFRGKHVIIIPDNDRAGQDHANSIANALRVVATSVKVIQLPGLQEGEDVSDWIRLGGQLQQLNRLVEDARESAMNVPPTGHSTLTPLRDLMSEPVEDISWLVEEMLPTGGFSMIASKPKIGKSTAARNLALCIATGASFLGREVNRGAVIYYALEEKRGEVRRHFEDMGATGREDIQVFVDAMPEDALVRIRRDIERIHPVLTIIDPLFRLVRARDGKTGDYGTMTWELEPLIRLARETGTHILCAHHTTKGRAQNSDSVLGSTAIFGSVDTLILLKRTDRYRTVYTEQRYGRDLEETVIAFDQATRKITIGETRQQADIEIISEAIKDLLQSHGRHMTEEEIISQVEGRLSIKRQALRNLVRQDYVERIGRGVRRDPFRYYSTLVPAHIRVQENENLEGETHASEETAENTSFSFPASNLILGTGNETNVSLPKIERTERPKIERYRRRAS